MIITPTDSAEGRKIVEYQGLVWTTSIHGVAQGTVGKRDISAPTFDCPRGIPRLALQY